MRVFRSMQAVYVCLLFGCYAGFLLLDVQNYFVFSHRLRYLGILICLLLAFSTRHFALSQKNWLLLVLALCFTCVADFILLFAAHPLIGVGVFCFAQLMHICRLSPPAFKQMTPIVIFILLCCAFASFLSINGFTLLLIVGGVYALLILMHAFLIFRADLPKQNANLLRIGILLFLCCDICVALYNLLPQGNLFYAPAGQLMWVFYLPSQALIALSAMDFSIRVRKV